MRKTFTSILALIMIQTAAWSAPITINVGNGIDGDLYVPAGETYRFDSSMGVSTTTLMMPASAGSSELVVNSTNGFSVGDEIMVYVAQASNTIGNAGSYETFRVKGVSGDNFITLNRPVGSNYSSDPSEQRISIQKVPNYRNVTIEGTLAANRYDGTHGGSIFFRVQDTLNISGTVSASNAGFEGGARRTSGTSYAGRPGTGHSLDIKDSTVGAGEGGTKHSYSSPATYGSGGGGGAYFTDGQNGQGKEGTGGQAYFDPSLMETNIPLAAGGGAGGTGKWYHYYRFGNSGGHGAGWIHMISENLDFTGTIQANGKNAENVHSLQPGGGGGGAGGLAWLQSYNALNFDPGQAQILVNGGSGTHNSVAYEGGDGGAGYSRVDFHYGPLPYGGYANEWNDVVNVVPEPVSLSLLGCGALFIRIRRSA